MNASRNSIMILAVGVLALGGLLMAGGAVSLAAPPTPTPQTGGWWGPGGMMGGGSGMMGGGNGVSAGPTGTLPFGASFCPMLGGAPDGTGTPLTMERAVQAAEAYIARYNNPDLRMTEVMEFSNNFYVMVGERSTGVHAFELLVDRYSGAVQPEPGPNMMWNTKYGMMGGGMMGGGRGRGMMGWGRQAPASSTAMPVTPAQAQQYAQTWLDANMPGVNAPDHSSAFYGYYTIDVERNEQVVGMLSVNGYSGAVWYHNWHGDFISERDFD